MTSKKEQEPSNHLSLRRELEDDAFIASHKKLNQPHHDLLSHALSLPLGKERDQAMKAFNKAMKMLEAPIRPVVKRRERKPTQRELEQNKRFQELLTPTKKEFKITGR